MSSTNQGVASALKYKVSYYTVGATLSENEGEYEVGNDCDITLPTITSTDGKNYKWILSIYGNEAGKNTTSHCAGPNCDVFEPGATVDLSNVYGAIEFCAVYVGCEIDCASKTNKYWEMGWAHATAGKYAVVELKNRTLYKDGYWNSLTLPFSLSAEKLATTCLAGADIRTFKEAHYDAANQRLTINFSSSNDGEIKAGVPCIIRWGEPGEAPGGTIENPYFTNVAVELWDSDDLNKTTNPYETESGGVRFEALISPKQVAANSRTFLLGAENTLYTPVKKTWVYATRAYFTYSGDLDISLARSVVMDFGDGGQQTTNIDNIMVADQRESNVEGIFNLSGQRLSAPQKGINIINGKKVVVK